MNKKVLLIITLLLILATLALVTIPILKFEYEKRFVSLDDKAKIDLMAKVSSRLDLYNTLVDQLPKSLEEVNLKMDLKKNGAFFAFIKNELKYSPLEDSLYTLCATFSTDIPKLNFITFEQKADKGNLPLGYQCFKLRAFSSHATAKVIEDKPYTGGVKSFADSHIQSVKNDSLYTLNSYTTSYTLSNGHSNDDINKVPGITKESGHAFFPWGFFNDTPNEWGLIAQSYDIKTSSPKALTVKIFFTQPVKLSNISNLFSNCQLVDCYSWEAVGISIKDAKIPLASLPQTGVDSKTFSTKDVVSDEQFKELDIKVIRVNN